MTVRRGAPGTRPALPALAVLPLLVVLGACSADAGRDPETYGIPAATAAPVRMEVCKPGTFIGTMTVNCPQVVR